MLRSTGSQVEEQPVSDSDQFYRYQGERDRRKTRRPLSWQILSIAVIGTLGFIIFLTVMLTESKGRADLLKDIRDTRYPVQENLLSALNLLETIDSNLEHAFIASNPTLLDHSMTMAAQFRAQLNQVILLERGTAEEINRILAAFDNFFKDSHTLTHSVISGQREFSETTLIKQANATAYKELMEALSTLQTNQSESLVASVDAATQRASDALRVNLTTGVLTALLLFSIAFLTTRSILQRINNMVSSLRQIAVSNGDMNVRIPLTGSDEMTELAFWFNTFLEKLQRITTESTAEVNRLAFTDTLTNLPNRRMFLRCLNNEIERLDEQQDATLAVFFLDLDNFKPVNDQLGHDAGDELIRIVAQRLVHTVRDDDTVSKNSDPSKPIPGQPVVARLAGDEFMMIVSDLKNPEQAAGIAERIRIAILESYIVNGMECSVGVSIGICLYPENSNDAEDLITGADMAMYEAKNRGKNTYRFYDPSLREATELKVQMDNAIKKAIPNGELHLMFQPQFSLSNGKLVGAEALLRWVHPELGTFAPNDFIKQAEANGQICELDDWVLNSVLDQLLMWENKGIKPNQVALNFSAAQASRPSLALAISRIAGTHRHLLSSIEVEITETSAIDNIAIVESNIQALKALDMKIAMDDFGAGHSSLTLLTRCAIDTLKIDKAVTREIKTDSKSRSIVQSIIDLANKLDVATVAEGIEDEAQALALAEMNCDLGQGYYYSKPLSASEFTEYLIQHKDKVDKAA
ncbi:hypothetical protein AB833_23795 [Chromatiales bacterium (ex Bugula neritina AB1)]|nr:hypothetical protein AB833_23795 [Chromatiales bacterium (ex Bugula neritina AB1)]